MYKEGFVIAIPGNLLTTAMGVMPHGDADRALELALSLDVPFWPQLPLLSYREDMYVQASENFPGILLDMDARTLGFSLDKFYEELPAALERWEDPSFFDISDEYSTVYGRFLDMDLADRPGIRGQMEGPISFGFNVQDRNKRPIIFDDAVRPVLIDFMARRVNAQLSRMKAVNGNAFMFVDEPGMQFLWSALAGYGDAAAKADLDAFFAACERPRGIHLCGNPDWQFLLGLDLDILSLDVYSNGEVFAGYAPSIGAFLERGGSLSWGIVPTNVGPFSEESVDSLAERLLSQWSLLWERGVDRDLMLSRSLISPATCCLVNPDKEKTVELAFGAARELSSRLRERFGLV